MAGLEDAAVDAAAQMLDEGAEQARVRVADRAIAVDGHMDFTHARLPGDQGLRCWSNQSIASCVACSRASP